MSRSSSVPSSSVPSPDLSRSSSTPSSVSSELPPDNSRPPSSELSSLPSSELSSVPTAPVTPSRDMLQGFFDICTDVAGGDPEAYDRAGGAGWQPGDYEDGGPYKSIF